MTIKHRVFRAPTMEPSLTLRGLQEKRHAEAEAFLNEIGADSVVSVSESGWESDFTIVVWYRDVGRSG